MNEVVRKSPLDFPMPNGFGDARAVPLLVTYDEPGEDLVLSLIPDKKSYLLGWELVSQFSYNLTLKSGSTTLVTYQFSANAGQGEPFTPQNPGIICNSETGEGLVLNCDQELPPFLMYVVEI